MSFIDGIYSFFVELNDTQREFYQNVKFKVVKHPEETFEFMLTRTLAYLHSYVEGIQFSQGLFEPKEPTFLAKDVTERITLWAEVGVPPKKKLTHALKHSTGATFRIYFCSEAEVIEFCHHMRGSKTNWVDDAEFYLIDNEFVELLTEHLDIRSFWNLTFCDDALYLTTGELDLQSKISTVDIWAWYQESISESSL